MPRRVESALVGNLGPERLEDRVVLSPATALDDFIKAPDPAYTYQTVGAPIVGNGFTAYQLLMTSQVWRSADDVDRFTWRHDVLIIIPTVVNFRTALLDIDGGSNTNQPQVLDANSEAVQQGGAIAKATGSIVAFVLQVPNQPLAFTDETRTRTEDASIAYTLDKYFEGGDETWPLLLPMVKSAVRAMDTVQSFVPTVKPGAVVQDFVLTGASKRGWTTWLTGAVDPRVKAINPNVINMLNIEPSIASHFANYGFFADAISPYDDLNVFGQFETLRGEDLLQILDPYVYKDRLALKPKFIMNSTGDEFFVPDSAKFYYNDLPGPKWMRFIPNTGHGLQNGAEQTVEDPIGSLVLFYMSVLSPVFAPLPEYSYTVDGNGTITAQVVPSSNPNTPPLIEARLWKSELIGSRDFRINYDNARNGVLDPGEWSSTVLTPVGGKYTANPPTPVGGSVAYMIEFTFAANPNFPISINGRTPTYKFTTEVHIKSDLPAYTTDFGDAPASYGTFLIDDGARHLVNPGYRLGNRLDAEFDGTPSSNAQGDDSGREYDDEDGVTFTSPINPGGVATVQVVVDKYASGAGMLNAWIDWNGDGSFDPGDQVFKDYQLQIGVNNLLIAVPITATASVTTYARFRYSSEAGIGPNGLAPDGEVEDYRITLSTPLLDWGDAPAPYPTTSAQNGPRHGITGGYYLGSQVDGEVGGQASQTANGDDTNGVDDDDGVVLLGQFVPGQTTTLRITASKQGYLNAWIDWNGNGSWADAGDQLFTNTLLSAGVNEFQFLTPINAVLNTTAFARFRFASAPGLTYTGPSPDGEVEDYAFKIEQAQAQRSISISDADVVEKGSGAVAVFVVNLSEAATQLIDVRYRTVGISARDGVDYVGGDGLVRFLPGSTQATIEIPIIGNAFFDPTRRFEVRLFDPINARTSDGLAEGIIWNGESQATLHLQQMFRSFLGRDYKPSGKSFWLNPANSFDDVLSGILASDEYYSRVGGTRVAFVTNLFRDLLGREGTTAEINARVTQLNQGTARTTIVRNLIATSEFTYFKQQKPFLDTLYVESLGRVASYSELWSGVKQLKAGLSPAQLAINLVSANANRQRTIEESMVLFLSGPADAASLSALSQALASGATTEDLLAGILGDDRYFALQGNNVESFVEAVHWDLLGRASTSDEEAYWISRLGGGRPARETMARAILGSTEIRVAKIEQWFQEYLGRAVLPNGRVFWAQRWANGGSPESIEASILASDEGRARAAAVLPVSMVPSKIASPLNGLFLTSNEQPLKTNAAPAPELVDELFSSRP